MNQLRDLIIVLIIQLMAQTVLNIEILVRVLCKTSGVEPSLTSEYSVMVNILGSQNGIPKLAGIDDVLALKNLFAFI